MATSHNGAPAKPPPAGIYVPVPTTEHSLFLVRGGIRGLVILGSTGEAIFLRKEERRELLQSQRKALDDAGFQDRPIIAGTATQNIDDTLDMIRCDKEAGAEYSMVLSPGYFASNTNQRGIQTWFETVADNAVLPILIYHYPGVTNNLYISPSTFEKLAAHPNIVGTKLSHGIIDDQTLIASNPRIDHEHFYVFTGLGQNLLPVLTIGGVAAIDGLAGVFPRIVVKLFNDFNSAVETGLTKATLAELRSLQFQVCEGERIIARWGPVGVKEACARLWGFGSTTGARLPLAGGFEDGETEWIKWDKTMSGLKRFEEQLMKK